MVKKKRSKHNSKAKMWALKRNGTKFLLTGILTNINKIRHEKVIVDTERTKLNGIARVLDQILTEWGALNALSKGIYLE